MTTLNSQLAPGLDTKLKNIDIRDIYKIPNKGAVSSPARLALALKSLLIDRPLSSVFGKYNPFSTEAVSSSHVVWLFDNTAYRPDGDLSRPWEAEFVAAYFDRDTGQDLKDTVATIADLIGVDDGKSGISGSDETRKRIRDRLHGFAMTSAPGLYLDLDWSKSGRVMKLGPGMACSSDVISQLGEQKSGQRLTSTTVREGLAEREVSLMETGFAEPEGWMVISDIDDTIKITMTPSPLGLIRSTFYDTPAVVPGMPELYTHIHKHLDPNWFYLSASPYNLYTFLRPFLRSNFPTGTLILREASWQNLYAFVMSLRAGVEEYKSNRISKVHSWLPKKKVLCVGDSTQSDPESYGDMYRKYGGTWIRAIFIHKVTGVSGMDDETKNSADRFEKAFRDVPRSVWTVYTDPKELYQRVESLLTI